MDLNLQFVKVATEQVGTCNKLYPNYHIDLVKLLVKVVATQSDGSSDARRRAEVASIVAAFGSEVINKIME